MAGPEALVVDTIRQLLERRSVDVGDIDLDADLSGDLELDSLELAELSAVLEDAYGTDPYTEGLVPSTAREIVNFYDGRQA